MLHMTNASHPFLTVVPCGKMGGADNDGNLLIAGE